MISYDMYHQAFTIVYSVLLYICIPYTLYSSDTLFSFLAHFFYLS